MTVSWSPSNRLPSRVPFSSSWVCRGDHERYPIPILGVTALPQIRSERLIMAMSGSKRAGAAPDRICRLSAPAVPVEPAASEQKDEDDDEEDCVHVLSLPFQGRMKHGACHSSQPGGEPGLRPSGRARRRTPSTVAAWSSGVAQLLLSPLPENESEVRPELSFGQITV
jgi:hypothetical protein